MKKNHDTLRTTMATAGLLEVEFSQPPDEIGWIYMDVTWPALPETNPHFAPSAQKKRSQARISYCYCAFRDLVTWMDAVARGADPVAVSWEDEGGQVELVYESSNLWFRNRGHEGWWSAEIPALEVAEAEPVRNFVCGA